MKKDKKSTGKLELDFPSMIKLKALKYKSCPIFQAYQKKNVEFTEATHAIYESLNVPYKSSKQLKLIFPYNVCIS